MFKFFREKIKDSISKFSRKIDEEGTTDETLDENKESVTDEPESEVHTGIVKKSAPHEEKNQHAKDEKPSEKKGFFEKIKNSFKKKEEKKGPDSSELTEAEEKPDAGKEPSERIQKREYIEEAKDEITEPKITSVEEVRPEVQQVLPEEVVQEELEELEQEGKKIEETGVDEKEDKAAEPLVFEVDEFFKDIEEEKPKAEEESYEKEEIAGLSDINIEEKEPQAEKEEEPEKSFLIEKDQLEDELKKGREDIERQAVHEIKEEKNNISADDYSELTEDETESIREDVSKKPTKEEPEEKKGFFNRLIKKEKPSEEKKQDKYPILPDGEPLDSKKASPQKQKKPEILEKAEEKKSKPEEPEEGKKGFFQKLKETIQTKKISESQFEEMFWELETALLENNVAMEVIEKIKKDLKDDIVEKPIRRSQISTIIGESLKKSISELFDVGGFDIIKKIRDKKEKPFVIAFVGINGSGKTTTIAKIAKMLKDKNISCVLAAADTFRAASIEQLQKHADAIGIRMIKHTYGSDPAAVAFDAIKHAQSKGIEAVLIDTAGRMHSNSNLIDEMKKIMRVANPDLKLFVGEAITGNDCVEQARQFNEAISIDGIILAKADVDEKGGAAVSVSYVTQKPILYLGTGQEYKDIEPFNKEKIISNLGLV